MSFSVIQHTSSINGFGLPGSPVLGSAPTAGNLLIFFLHCNIASSSITVDTTKWTDFKDAVVGTQQYGMALYRYAVLGDSATLPKPWTAGNTYSAWDVFEVSGVTGTFVSDVVASDAQAKSLSTGTLTSGTLTTSASNALALMGFGQYNGSNTPTLSGFGTWTSDEAGHNASNYGSDVGGEQAIPTSGSGVNVTVTASPTNNPTDLFLIIIQSPVDSATGGLAFGPHAFNAAGGPILPSATGGLAFGPHAFSAAGGPILPIGTGSLAFGPHAFSATGTRVETSSGFLAFGPAAFAGVATHVRSATGGLAFGPAAFAGVGNPGATASGGLAFGPAAIVASGLIAPPTGTGKRNFWTFGA